MSLFGLQLSSTICQTSEWNVLLLYHPQGFQSLWNGVTASYQYPINIRHQNWFKLTFSGLLKCNQFADVGPQIVGHIYSLQLGDSIHIIKIANVHFVTLSGNSTFPRFLSVEIGVGKKIFWSFSLLITLLCINNQLKAFKSQNLHPKNNMEQSQACSPNLLIGNGSTSDVFSWAPNGLGSDKVIKLCQGNKSSIQREVEILKTLKGEEGFPILDSWEHYEEKSWIVMEKLGVSVKNIVENTGPLPVQWVVKTGLQMLSRLQTLHEKGYLHIDLKPEHFMFGQGHKNQMLHLIDFGMSQKICNSPAETTQRSKQQNQSRSSKNSVLFKGNILYCSVSQMLGQTPTIRDELCSLTFIAGELLEGELPWGGLNSKIPLKKRYQTMLHMKQKQQGWKRFGWWVRETLKMIQSSDDPYYGFRLMVCKLLDLY